jgi:hypothetical protein
MIELEFRNVDLCGGRKTLEARERINNKLNSLVGIDSLANVGDSVSHVQGMA